MATPTATQLETTEWDRFFETLLEQYSAMGDRCSALADSSDRFAALMITVIGGAGALVVTAGSFPLLVAGPPIWSAILFLSLRSFKEVFAFGGARRAIEEAVRDREALIVERLVVREVVREKLTTVPYIGLLGLLTAAVLVIGQIAFRRLVVSFGDAYGWLAGAEWIYAGYLLVTLGVLVTSIVNVLGADERSFLRTRDEIADVIARRLAHLAPPTPPPPTP